MYVNNTCTAHTCVRIYMYTHTYIYTDLELCKLQASASVLVSEFDICVTRQACEAWKQIMAVCPGEKECFLGLADAAISCGKYEEALDYYSQCLSLSSSPDGHSDIATLTKIGTSPTMNRNCHLLYTCERWGAGVEYHFQEIS